MPLSIVRTGSAFEHGATDVGMRSRDPLIALHWEQKQKCPSKKNNRLVPGNSRIASRGLSPRCSPGRKMADDTVRESLKTR